LVADYFGGGPYSAPLSIVAQVVGMKNRETIYGELFDEFHKEADKIRRFPQRLKPHCGLEFYGGTKVSP